MPNSELRTTAADGHAWVMPLRQAGDARAGLLWLPALGVPAEKYTRFAEALAQRGITVAVQEWRGTGSSSLRASRRVDWGYRELLATDLAAGWAAARRQAPALPWFIGGHSLGGQLAALHAARAPVEVAALVLVATGVPHARVFTGRQRWGVALFARSLPLITALSGHYPGERLGFAGREASRVMRDWAGTVLSGRYQGFGLDEDHEAAMRAFDKPALALLMAEDWLAPRASMQGLLDKLGGVPKQPQTVDAKALGDRADHFRWLRSPGAVAERIAAWADGPAREAIAAAALSS